jgi:L-aminopeptidase/D-esterase-like protein
VPSRTLDFGSIRGVSVGQAEAPDGKSGVTVVLFDRAVPMVVDVRGGASATYDTSSLSLDATFGRRWAVFFSGGSVYGLDAARGVRTRILELGRGHHAFPNPNVVVPITGAALFDLPTDRGAIPDYLPLGYEAARRARPGPVAVGRVGAGAGATVGKYLGRRRAMAGGVGTAARRLGRRGTVGVLVAINSLGAVRDPSSGEWVAGARSKEGRVAPPRVQRTARSRTTSTTLTLVATDLTLGRATLARIAAIVHAGLASAISPFHSSTDGDVLFVASTEHLRSPWEERRPGELADLLGSLAADMAVEAVLGAVRAAQAEP